MNRRLVGALAVTTLALVGSRSHAQQITVTYQAAPGEPNIVDSTGTALANTDPTLGLTVELGYFTSGFNISANAGNLSALGANWHLFDSTFIQSIDGTTPGQFTGSKSSNDSSFTGMQVDLWIFKTSDGHTPTAGFGNVLEYGLFSSTVPTSTTGTTTFQWVFPAVSTAPPGNAPIWTSADVANHPVIYWGGVTAGGASLQLEAITAVPEPSGLMLLGCGAIFAGLVIRRRRQ